MGGWLSPHPACYSRLAQSAGYPYLLPNPKPNWRPTHGTHATYTHLTLPPFNSFSGGLRTSPGVLESVWLTDSNTPALSLNVDFHPLHSVLHPTAHLYHAFKFSFHHPTRIHITSKTPPPRSTPQARSYSNDDDWRPAHRT